MKLLAILLAVIALCVAGVVILDLISYNSDYPFYQRNRGDPDPNGKQLLTIVLPTLLVSGLLWRVARRRGS